LEPLAGKVALVPADSRGAPEEIAATVSHLAGPGGRYISGTSITVDGGFAA
jgi:3-oxoacyl-[acyl-carrier protein] reductase